MTYLEAAIQVLTEAGEPLHYSEITKRALAASLIEPQGATPEQSMASRLYVAAKKGEGANNTTAVKSVSKGVFALGATAEGGRLEDEIARSNASVHDDLLAFLREIDPRQLELLVGELLTELGYENVEVTQYFGDKGIDVRAVLTAGGVASVNTAVQVKRTGSVGGPEVQRLRGSLEADQRGLIITTGTVSPAGKTEAVAAGKLPIALVDGEHLVQLMLENGIGVRRRSTEILELDLESLVFEDEGTSALSPTLWPLPGGKAKFFESLLAFLDKIGLGGVDVSEMTAWVIHHFEKVTKEGLVNSYLRSVLYSMDLIRFDGEVVLLTDTGVSLRQSRSSVELAAILQRQVLGVSELIKLLEDGGPQPLDKLHRQLVKEIGRTWETTHQTRFRLEWLAVAGVVELRDKDWQLTERYQTLLVPAGGGGPSGAEQPTP